MPTKTYIARETFIWKLGTIVEPGAELELTDSEAKGLLWQTRVVPKPEPVTPPAEITEDARGKSRGKKSE